MSNLYNAIMHRLLFWVSGFLKVKIINNEQGKPYLERYMLLRWGDRVFFLHRFLDSDSDRGVHDHPWDYSCSFILAGGYHEERLVPGSPDKVVVRDVRALSFNRILGNDFHRIVLKPGIPAWTVFYHAQRTKTWGFQIYDLLSPDTREITRLAYEVYEDKTNPADRWEDRAPRGFSSARKGVDFQT